MKTKIEYKVKENKKPIKLSVLKTMTCLKMITTYYNCIAAYFSLIFNILAIVLKT
jgi:hypothetical protein